MTPSEPRTLLGIGQINLLFYSFIPPSYERNSDAPPHVLASPCAVAARMELKLCTAANCDCRQQPHAFARRTKDWKTVFGPLGTFFFRKNKSYTSSSFAQYFRVHHFRPVLPS